MQRSKVDENDQSPFMTLIMNGREDILQYIATEKVKRGYFDNSTWLFEDYFDLTTEREDGLTDLERLIVLAQENDSNMFYKDCLELMQDNVRPALIKDATCNAYASILGQNKRPV